MIFTRTPGVSFSRPVVQAGRASEGLSRDALRRILDITRDLARPRRADHRHRRLHPGGPRPRAGGRPRDRHGCITEGRSELAVDGVEVDRLGQPREDAER